VGLSSNLALLLLVDRRNNDIYDSERNSKIKTFAFTLMIAFLYMVLPMTHIMHSLVFSLSNMLKHWQDPALAKLIRRLYKTTSCGI